MPIQLLNNLSYGSQLGQQAGGGLSQLLKRQQQASSLSPLFEALGYNSEESSRLSEALSNLEVPVQGQFLRGAQSAQIEQQRQQQAEQFAQQQQQQKELEEQRKTIKEQNAPIVEELRGSKRYAKEVANYTDKALDLINKSRQQEKEGGTGLTVGPIAGRLPRPFLSKDTRLLKKYINNIVLNKFSQDFKKGTRAADAVIKLQQAAKGDIIDDLDIIEENMKILNEESKGIVSGNALISDMRRLNGYNPVPDLEAKIEEIAPVMSQLPSVSEYKQGDVVVPEEYPDLFFKRGKKRWIYIGSEGG